LNLVQVEVGDGAGSELVGVGFGVDGSGLAVDELGLGAGVEREGRGAVVDGCGVPPPAGVIDCPPPSLPGLPACGAPGFAGGT
jgi:hypothetical protein